MRKPLVAGNWKMNGSSAMVAGLLDDLIAGLAEDCNETEVVVFPPFIYLSQAKDALDGSSVAWGAQNICAQEGVAGAYTGETAVAMVAESGCSHVLVGHSERRALYGETDTVVAAKFALVAGQNLVPVLCVGEMLDERERGETLSVVSCQLGTVLDSVDTALLNDFVVAYEPVWAIGTGMTATPQQAQDVHAGIRALLGKRCPDMAARTRILYGGSVKASNAIDILSQSDVDGALVGGASLKAEEFLAICRAAG